MTQEHEDRPSCTTPLRYCVLKFLSVKMVVFLTFWQGYFFPLFITGERRVNEAWQDLILILEAGFFTICMTWAFNWREFAIGNISGAESFRNGGAGVQSSSPGDGGPATEKAGAATSIAQLARGFVTRPSLPGSSAKAHSMRGEGVEKNGDHDGGGHQRRPPPLEDYPADSIIPRVEVVQEGRTRSGSGGASSSSGVVVEKGTFFKRKRKNTQQPSAIGAPLAVQLDTYEIGHIGEAGHDSGGSPMAAPEQAERGTSLGNGRIHFDSVDGEYVESGRGGSVGGGALGAVGPGALVVVPPPPDDGDHVTTQAGDAAPDPAEQTKANKPTSPKAEPRWLKNAKTAFNPKDVLTDAKRSFSTRYNQHVLMEASAQEEVLRSEFHSVRSGELLSSRRKNMVNKVRCVEKKHQNYVKDKL